MSLLFCLIFSIMKRRDTEKWGILHEVNQGANYFGYGGD